MSGQFLTALLVAAIALVLWRYVLLVAAAALLALILIGTGFIGAGHTEAVGQPAIVQQGNSVIAPVSPADIGQLDSCHPS